MSDYVRRIREIDDRKVEVDGDGGVDIASRYALDADDVIMLDFSELEQIYYAARAHRTAYQAYARRGHTDLEQYERDYKEAMQNEIIMWRKLEEK